MTFTPEQKELMISSLKEFMTDTLGQDLGTFETMDLLDFISSHLGVLYYNRGLLDAQALLSSRADLLVEAIAELEKESPLGR